MKLNLTVWQRETIRLRAGNLRGPLALMRKGALVLDAVELTEEEKKKVGYRRSPQGFQWDDAEIRFPIEIKDHEALNLTKRVVQEVAEELERKEAWTLADADGLPDLCKQLKIDLDEIVAKIDEEKVSAAEKEESKGDEPAE
jgi:hypothetical protein